MTPTQDDTSERAVPADMLNTMLAVPRAVAAINLAVAASATRIMFSLLTTSVSKATEWQPDLTPPAAEPQQQRPKAAEAVRKETVRAEEPRQPQPAAAAPPAPAVMADPPAQPEALTQSTALATGALASTVEGPTTAPAALEQTPALSTPKPEKAKPAASKLPTVEPLAAPAPARRKATKPAMTKSVAKPAALSVSAPAPLTAPWVPEAALVFDDANVTPKAPPLLAEPKGTADALSAIKGITPRLATQLNRFGIYHYSQIAAWKPEEIAWINDKLDFMGRVQREKWVQQARALVGSSR